MLKLLTLDAVHFRFSSARHPFCTPAQRRFALDGYSARGLADKKNRYPASPIGYHVKLSAYAICPGKGQGWYMGGPGMERGLERYGPLQHSTATVAHLYQIRKFSGGSNAASNS